MSRRVGTAVVSAVVAGLGVAVLVETAIVGGEAGYALGAAIMLAGIARFYLTLR